MMVENIQASSLLPAELRDMMRIKRRAELVSGLKLSMRDPKLFNKVENILKGLGQEQYSEQLWDLEEGVSNRVNGTIGSVRIDPALAEIDEEYLADGTKVTVENHKTCGFRVKYYDQAL